MDTPKFRIGQALSVGWETFKGHAGYFVGVFILGSIAYMIPSFISSATAEDYPTLSFLFNLIGIIVSYVVSAGWIFISLSALDKKPLTVDMLWSKWQYVAKFVGAGILSTLAIMIGLVLLIIPGIIVACRLALVGFYLIDKNQGIIEAMKSSWEATRGSAWNLFLYFVVLGLIGIAATIPLGLGWLIAAPFMAISVAYVYRQVAGIHHAAPAAAAQPAQM